MNMVSTIDGGGCEPGSPHGGGARRGDRMLVRAVPAALAAGVAATIDDSERRPFVSFATRNFPFLLRH